MRNYLSIIAAVLLLGWGCVGTDFITDPPATVMPHITIAPAIHAMRAGETVQLSAVYYDSLGGSDPRAHFDWSSTSSATVSVNATGLATGHQPGQAAIYARAHGISSPPALITVVVDSTEIAAIRLSPDSVRLQVGEMVQFAAVATTLAGDTLAVPAFTWASSDPQIAAIDTLGRLSGLLPGRATITAAAGGITSPSAAVMVTGRSRSGAFMANPATSYRVSGTATLTLRDNGDLVLNFGGDFSSSNGPGLYVYLSTTNRVTSSSLELGRLQSTGGAQSYPVPAGVRITDYDWAIVHCKPFNVTFGWAELQR